MQKQTFRRGARDWFMSVLMIPAALAMRHYRTLGALRLPRTTQRLRDMGVYPVRNQYYEPLFDPTQLTEPLENPRHLPGVDLNAAGQLRFLRELTHGGELADVPLDRHGAHVTQFTFGNGTFESGDAEFLYQFVRSIKPRKIVEIGSGNSTKIAAAALKANQRDSGQACEHICIEPYEMRWLEQLGTVRVIRKRLQDCAIDWAAELGPNDLLFIDSSHIIRPQGDVLKEYLEVLPQLRPGVFVHVHDIFTPRDYLRSWVVDQVLFWNEQYLLEALLTNTNRYEVVAALNYLKTNHFDELKTVCPYLTPDREPGSFYIRVTQGAH